MRSSILRAIAALLSTLVAGIACASQDSNGPNGINSIATGLTGVGIRIGQVDVTRPGKPGAGFDDADHSNPTIVPTQIALLDDPTPPLNMNVDDHAEAIAGVMISSDPLRTGVAPSSLLYASAYAEPVNPAQPQAALAAQHVALQASNDVRAINMSFGESLVGTDILDGNSLLTQFVDWSAAEENVLYVVAGNEGDGGIPVPTDNFNGLTVAFSEKNADGVYRNVPVNVPGVSFGNNFSYDSFGDRTTTDIVAPGGSIQVLGVNDPATASGTSLATPHVTGTVALLQQYAEQQITAGAPNWNSEARRHEVIKAVLMNSADKIKDTGNGKYIGMSRTLLDHNGNDWLTSEAYFSQTIPLDDEMGAGHLNASRALTQFSAPHNPDSFTGQLIGWDYGSVSFPGTAKVYEFSGANRLEAGTFFSATVAWDREVQFDQQGTIFEQYQLGDTFEDYVNVDEVVTNLDLYLVPVNGTLEDAVWSERSTSDSIEHMFTEIPVTGAYTLRVVNAGGANSQDFGIAWWAGKLTPTVTSDFNNDGMVDGADLAQWRGDFGPTDNGSDADGDGDSDGADFLAWQRELGTGVPAVGASAIVPEPAGWLLAALGLLLIIRRRSV